MPKFKPARNIDDAWAAVDAFPLEPGDPRYVDCSAVRNDAMRQIERMLNRHAKAGRDLHLLFTGYRGNGKTTELYHLANKVKKSYEVIYFDASNEMDVNNMTLSDVLLAIAKEIADSLHKKNYTLPKKLLEEVGNWFAEKVLEDTKEVTAAAGAEAEAGSPKWFGFITARVFSNVKIGTEKREIQRRKLESNITDLIAKVNALLTAARAEVKATGKDILFVMDSLDRLRAGLDKTLFLGDGAKLKQLKGHFIYVVPISLLYDPQATLLPFDEKMSLPMIPIYKPGLARDPHDKGIAYLTDLIQRRLVTDDIFTDPKASIAELILASGGHLRDLIKLLSYACNRTDDKIEPEHVTAAINNLMRDYENVILDEEYDHVIAAYRTQNPPNNETNQKLIYNNVILVYRQNDDSEWKDVHPVVVRNAKFQKANQKLQTRP